MSYKNEYWDTINQIQEDISKTNRVKLEDFFEIQEQKPREHYKKHEMSTYKYAMGIMRDRQRKHRTKQYEASDGLAELQAKFVEIDKKTKKLWRHFIFSEKKSMLQSYAEKKTEELQLNEEDSLKLENFLLNQFVNAEEDSDVLTWRSVVIEPETNKIDNIKTIAIVGGMVPIVSEEDKKKKKKKKGKKPTKKSKKNEDSNEDSSASEAEESKEETKYEYQKLDVHIIEKKKKVNDDLFENKPTVKSLYSSSKHAKKVKNTKPENKPENKPEKK
jgi:hypothetical protein